MEPSTCSPRGGRNDSGSGGWMGGGCGGLAGYGPPRVEPSPASAYPRWEQPGSMWAPALGQLRSTPLIRVQIASLGCTSGPGAMGREVRMDDHSRREGVRKKETEKGRLWLKQMEGNRRAKQKPTATRHSSTKDVSMCGRMVTMMSLKSRPEMEPLWAWSRWMNACRACSSCISCGRGGGGGG
ncbi:hypothetical protein EYF80_017603 [Liparis tanakae]|uniref:Uncharacterized protein n=1 Tax=Liparis tanakae TaxID=230148 RepID=A0A4Z2I3Y9_9TELE|nr:hypothetical protein EYF80_017603 [Liparis tanakae]